MDDLITQLTSILPAKYKTTILVVMLLSPYLTRGLYSIRNGGGIKGLFTSIWLGTNTPKSQQTATKDQTNEKPTA